MRAAHWSLILAIGLSAPVAVTPSHAVQADLRYSSAPAQYGPRIWLEGEPSYFRRGDRLNVRFSVPYDAYVAILHIDTDGYLDFLYPADPWDNHFVRGGRTHSLSVRGSLASLTIRSRPGIGYVYLVASPTPLDFRYFQGGLRGGWDWDYAGRNVYGDPFLAFDQVTRFLLPRWPYAPYTYDFHGYYVEGLHRYPNYACSDRFYDYGWGWSPGFGSCGRIDVFLRQYPDYYDTRRFRGDRRVYLRQYERLDPRHGFKEDPEAGRVAVPRAPSPAVVPGGSGGGGADGAERRGAVPAQPSTTPRQAPVTPDRSQPTTPARDQPTSPAPADRSRPEPQPRAPADGRAPSTAPAPAPAPTPGERTRPVPVGRP